MPTRRRFDVSVQQPCTENWDAMRAHGRERFCESCERSVNDLSRMTDGQVEELAMRAAAGERVCARVTRRSDGSLVTLGSESTQAAKLARGALLAGAFAAGIPAAAQELGGAVDTQSQTEVILKEVAPQPQPVPGKAVVIGRLLHPDGRRVETGLVYVQDANGMQPLYVVDASGWFEIHVPPGVYDFVLQTGKDQVESVPAVVLHEGVQEFGD